MRKHINRLDGRNLIVCIEQGEVACLGESLGDWVARTFGSPWDAPCLPVPAFPPVPFWGDLMLL